MTIVAAQFEQPWGSGSEVCTTGNVFVPGPGGTTPPDDTVDLTPLYIIPAAPKYNLVHTVTVTHNGVAVEFVNFTIATDDGSLCWTLNATGGPELFTLFATAEEAIVVITIDGQEWQFIVEGVRRSRQFPSAPVSLTGRSITILAGDPYSFVQNWVNVGPITAAQIVDQAQDFTEVEVLWGLEDWLVPDRVWYFTGTPLAVAQRVAESVSALVVSSRNEKAISILPRYPTLPHEWPTTPPDVEIHADALIVDSYERADRPAYNAVMVSGQQQGAVGRIFLSGTAADKLAPLVTDLLLTDIEALRQRGMAILGQSGPQAHVQATLPVIVADQGPGVLNLNQLCHVIGDGDDWWGMVRSVSVVCQLPSVLQSVTLERHTADIVGTVVTEDVVDTPTAGALAVTLGAVTLASSGQLPGGGVLAKTLGAVTLASAGGVALSGALSKTLGAVTLSADSTIVTPVTDLIRMLFNGANGGSVFTDDGTAGLTWTRSSSNVVTSTSGPQEGAACLSITGSTEYLRAPYSLALGSTFFIGGWYRPIGTFTSRAFFGVQNVGFTAAGSAFLCYCNASNQFDFYYSDGTTINHKQTTTATIGTSWQYLSAYLVGGTLYVQINGGTPATVAFAGSLNLPVGQNISFGANPDNTGPNSGVWDMWEVRTTIPAGITVGATFTPPTTPWA